MHLSHTTTPVIINHRNSPQHYPYGTAWWEGEDDTGHIETGMLGTVYMYAVYLSAGLARLFGEGRRGWMLPPRNNMNTYSALDMC